MATASKVRKFALKEANEQGTEEMKALRAEHGGIPKTVTTFGTTAAKDAAGEPAPDGSVAGVMTPTPEELDKINQFTRSPKTAEQVAVFETLSCNDMEDRDDEFFSTKTVKQFAELPEPYGPVGKGFMLSHDYSKMPVGRIFDTGTKAVTLDPAHTSPGGEQVDKATFHTDKIYIPNTDANKSLIENYDFGVYWAVSVGVVLDAAECSLPWCGAPMYVSRFFGGWCQEGHDQGYYYTADAESDKWGFVEPSDPKDTGATKCLVRYEGGKDYYELSGCFLGAQYFAALDKQASDVSMKGILKAATARSIPIIGLSAKEADAFALPHLDDRVKHAVRAFGARPDDNGVYNWVDDQKLKWVFDPEEQSEGETGVMCLGKSEGDDAHGTIGQPQGQGPEADATASEPHGDTNAERQDASDTSAVEHDGEETADGRVGASAEQEAGRQDGDLTNKSGHTHAHVHADGTNHSHNHTHSGDNAYQHVNGDNVSHTHTHDNSGKEASVSKSAVLAALRSLKAPEVVLAAVEQESGDDLAAGLRPLVATLSTQSSQIEDLTPKAEMGGKYLEQLRADAIDWYVRANQSGENKGVSTDSFQKLLDTCGDNAELITLLSGEQKKLAQAKFAGGRSSVAADPNETSDVQLPERMKSVDKTDETVSRIHG